MSYHTTLSKLLANPTEAERLGDEIAIGSVVYLWDDRAPGGPIRMSVRELPAAIRQRVWRVYDIVSAGIDRENALDAEYGGDMPSAHTYPRKWFGFEAERALDAEYGAESPPAGFGEPYLSVVGAERPPLDAAESEAVDRLIERKHAEHQLYIVRRVTPTAPSTPTPPWMK